MKLWLALLMFVGPALAQPQCTQFDVSQARTVQLLNLCKGWKAWLVQGDMVIACPGTAKPVGGIELREFYQIGDRAQ